MKKTPMWKPSKSMMRYPTLYREGRIGFFVENENGVRSIWVWMSTKEAKEFAEALMDSVYYNERISGIRNQNFTFRWF